MCSKKYKKKLLFAGFGIKSQMSTNHHWMILIIQFGTG
jgi:hypothetical protein